MPVSPLVDISNTTARGLRTAFIGTYDTTVKELATGRLGLVMGLDLPSDGINETYAYFESAPHPRRWDRGDAMTLAGFLSKKFTVVNRDWAIGVQWHKNDEQDDRLGGLVARGEDTGRNFGLLHERIWFQILQGTSDFRLLPAVPNAPDGVAMFSATDGDGGNRFGVSGGNIVATSGVATPSAIITDYHAVKARFRNVRDTTPEAQFRWDDSIIDNGGFVILFNAANEQVFAEAFKAAIVLRTQTVGANNTGTAAGVSNVILAQNPNVVLWPTARITDNKWYVGLLGTPYRAIFNQLRQGIEETFEDQTNSDRSRDYKTKSLRWDARYGYGLGLPLNWVQVA